MASVGARTSGAVAGGDTPALGPRGVELPEHLRGRSPVPPAPPPGQEILSARDLAGLLMMPMTTIYRLWRQTDIPGRMIGKELRFIRADVIAWISTGNPAGEPTGDAPLPEETSNEPE